MSTAPEDTQMELAKLRNELEQTQQAMQAMIYTISHDLGAPLRAVTGFADILQRSYSHQLDDKGKSYLNFLKEGGSKAQDMLQALLAYSRVYSQGAQAETVSLQKIAKQVLSERNDEGLRQNIVTNIETLPDCLCDHKQIKALFTILLENALKFKRPSERLSLQINGKDTGTEIAVSVEDNGIGVPPEARQKIFQLFKRGHHDEPYADGLGMGLAIAERIVKRHHGEIQVTPSQTGGSTFTFTLSKAGPDAPWAPAERT